MDFGETPQSVFARIQKELQGTDKAPPLKMINPNTGREVDVTWDFSYRFRGKETPLQASNSLVAQGVGEGALLVARVRDIRAHTIYIDGTEGLGEQELAAAKSKMPMIIGMLMLLFFGGGTAYYYLISIPEQKRRAPYLVDFLTEPKGAEVKLTLDMREIDKQQTYQTLSIKTPTKGVEIHKKAQLVYISIEHKGYKSWTHGYTKEQWEKDRQLEKKLPPISIQDFLLKPGNLPDEIDKLPEPPKFVKLEVPQPQDIQVTYPRRWRRMSIGIDPTHGGEHKGIASTSSDITASTLNLQIAQSVATHLTKLRWRYHVLLSRKADQNPSHAQRMRNLLRSQVIIQIDFASGTTALPEANAKDKQNDQIVTYNDSVAGYQILWSADNRNSSDTQKLAGCLDKSLQKAGFLPYRLGQPQNTTIPTSGIQKLPSDTKDPILSGNLPAVRLLPAHLTHRAETKLMTQNQTHLIIAKTIEEALICYQS
jgi:N-acetylmuramoyl-L-alanine amidase